MEYFFYFVETDTHRHRDGIIKAKDRDDAYEQVEDRCAEDGYYVGDCLISIYTKDEVIAEGILDEEEVAEAIENYRDDFGYYTSEENYFDQDFNDAIDNETLEEDVATTNDDPFADGIKMPQFDFDFNFDSFDDDNTEFAKRIKEFDLNTAEVQKQLEEEEKLLGQSIDIFADSPVLSNPFGTMQQKYTNVFESLLTEDGEQTRAEKLMELGKKTWDLLEKKKKEFVELKKLHEKYPRDATIMARGKTTLLDIAHLSTYVQNILEELEIEKTWQAEKARLAAIAAKTNA